MMLEKASDGQFFRNAWIAGVNKHFPGTPKPGYVAPWSEMAEWEQKAANVVYEKTRAFIQAGLQDNVTPEQGGRFISEAWNVQVYRHTPSPKPSYVADWEELPEWQRKTDMDIFEAITVAVREDR
jgi:hypothetical protein